MLYIYDRCNCDCDCDCDDDSGVTKEEKSNAVIGKCKQCEWIRRCFAWDTCEKSLGDVKKCLFVGVCDIYSWLTFNFSSFFYSCAFIFIWFFFFFVISLCLFLLFVSFFLLIWLKWFSILFWSHHGWTSLCALYHGRNDEFD